MLHFPLHCVGLQGASKVTWFVFFVCFFGVPCLWVLHCLRFLELLVLPYTTVNQITDWYELVDAEDAVLGIGAFGAVHRCVLLSFYI